MHDVEIKRAQVGTTLRDDQIKGLLLRTFANRQSFYLHYTTKLGVERKPKIADYGIVTLAKAREIARGILSLVAEGKDPAAELQKQKQLPNTMGELWTRYKTKMVDGKKSAKDTIRQWHSYLEKPLAGMLVADVDLVTIEDIHDSMRKTPVQANRTLALMSGMLKFAERYKLRPVGSSPCEYVERYPEKSRKRYMVGEEAARISEILNANSSKYPDSVAFIYLLILTGARKGEIGAARWDWIDGQTLRLPDSKTGEKTVYLPVQVMDILAKLPKTRDTICGMTSPKTFWNRIRMEAGCPDLRMHDLRHSFASAALQAGLTLAQIGELLGHASTQTTKRYAHLMEDAAHASVASVADAIERRMAKPLSPVLETK